jgi:TP901 family phage tail tape measure protein
MPITASQLITEVSAKGVEEAQAKLLTMGQTSDDVGRKLAIGLAGASIIGGAALLAMGVKVASMAGDFKAGITTLVTGAGESAGMIDSVSHSILAIAPALGTTTKQLTDGMFMIDSAGFKAANGGLLVLQNAAMGAKVGAADLGVVANAVTTELVDYGMGAEKSAYATNILISTVKAGKTHMQDLAGALSAVLPTSAAVHVSLTDVSGAMATMTAEGTPAADAATYLRQMLLALEVPGAKAVKVFKEIGLSTASVASEMKVSLPGALQMIIDHLKTKFPEGSAAFVAALKDMAGGQKNFQAWLELTGTHLKTFKDDATGIASTARKAGDEISGWALVQEDFNFKLDQAKAVMETLGIRVGSLLLPALSKVLDTVMPLVSAFSDWALSGHAIGDMIAFFNSHANVLIPILAGVGAVLVAIIVPAFISLAGAAWSAAVGVIAATWPILAIGAAVAGLVAIFMHFYQTNAEFKTFIDNLVTGFRTLWSLIQANFIPTMQRLGAFFQSTILPALQQVGSFLISTFRPAWEQLVATWKGQLLPAIQMLWGLFQQLLPVLKVVGMVLIGVLIVALVAVVATIALVLKWLALLIQGWSWLIAATGAAFSAIGTTITNFKNLVGNIFNAIGTFIHDKILWIYNHNIYIKTFVDLIINFLHNLQVVVGAVFATIASLIGQKLAQAQSFAANFRDALGSIFSQLGSSIQGKISAIGSFLASTIGGWANAAFQWGASLIQGFINGIGSQISAVADKASQVAQTVAHFLGFHSSEFGVPPEGAGHEADKWMPAFMKGLAGGITAGTPAFHAALAQLMAPVGTSLSGGGPAAMLAPGYTAPMMAGSMGGSGGSKQPVIINVHLAGRNVGQVLLPDIVAGIRSAVGTVNL